MHLKPLHPVPGPLLLDDGPEVLDGTGDEGGPVPVVPGALGLGARADPRPALHERLGAVGQQTRSVLLPLALLEEGNNRTRG